jgi:Spy/CpxP family protein refolding chaperone
MIMKRNDTPRAFASRPNAPNAERRSLFLSGAGILGIAAAGWLTLQTSYAQNGIPQPPPQNQQRGARQAPPAGPGPQGLARALGLSDDQKEQLQAIEDDFRTQMKALQDAKKQKILALLTPDQAKIFETLPPPPPMAGPPHGPAGPGAPQGPQGAQGPQEPHGPGRPGLIPPTVNDVVAGMTQRLALTADQAGRIKDILTAAQSQQTQLLQSLSDSNANADGPAIREQLRTLNDTTREKIFSLLSDDQKSKLPPPPPGNGPDGPQPPAQGSNDS